MNIRFNRLLAGIAAAAALSVTQAAQAGAQPPAAPRPVVLQLNHPAPVGVIPPTTRAVTISQAANGVRGPGDLAPGGLQEKEQVRPRKAVGPWMIRVS
jgi:hypothetical protein